jgi:hypothetical protein
MYIRRTRGYFRRGLDAWIRREGKGTRLEVFHKSLPLLGQGPRFIEHSSRIKPLALVSLAKRRLRSTQFVLEPGYDPTGSYVVSQVTGHGTFSSRGTISEFNQPNTKLLKLYQCVLKPKSRA